MKNCLVFCLLFVFKQAIAQKIAVPYYSNSEVKFYDISSAPADLLGTLSTTVSGISYKPNCVAFYNNEMFVGYDEPSSDGFLHYKGVSVSGGTVTYTSVVKVLLGRVTTEIVVNPANGTLYVACGFGDSKRRVLKMARDGSGTYGSSTGIFQNTPALKNAQTYSGIGGITRTASGDIFVTDLSDNRILKWAGDQTLAQPTQFLCTTAANSVACSGVFLNTDNQSAKLFSLPEGLAMDGPGNLWFANNNDGYSPTVDATGGSLVKLSSNLVAQNTAGGTLAITALDATIYSKSGAKFGGLCRIGSFIYASDQGNGKVWKFDPSDGSFTDIGISATYPGNGQCAEPSPTIFPSFTIVSCAYPNFGGTVVRFGNQTSVSVRANIDIDAPGDFTINVTGPNFSGTATQNFASPGLQSMFITVDYDGLGTAGTKTLNLSSPSPNVGACSLTIPVYDSFFTFGDCETSLIDGTFTQNVAATHNITLPIAVTKAGTTTFTIISQEFSGSLTTSLTLGQTSVIVPITYTPSNSGNTSETLTFASNEAAGAYPSLPGFCYKSIQLLVPNLPCPELLTLPLDDAAATLINSGNRTYSAQKIVANNSEITGSANVVFSAAKSVTLMPGFRAGNQAVFTAQISNCPNNIPPSATMYIQGRDLFDANHQKFLPVGINYPTDYWQFSGANEYVNQVDLSGANMARIVWFQNEVAGTSHTDTDLNTLITKFAAKKITPVLTLWNGYINDPNQLNTPNGYVSWWIDPARVNMLNTHKKYLVINIINELGFGRGFAYDPNLPSDVAAFTNWKNQYKIAITNLRNAGLDVPLMIDAPIGGTSLKLINLAAPELLAHDPKHNLIFSIHAYWAEDDQTNELNTAINNNIPLIFGELANRQLGADNWSTNPATGYSECYYGIDGTAVEHAALSGYNYKNLLPILKTNGIGWLGWEWLNDGCPSRNLTTDGNFLNLTTFGNDLINNVNYGMKNFAVKSEAF
jgi:mannan endo-1,4-beta-mannosidase